jgi:hypothetical protein
MKKKRWRKDPASPLQISKARSLGIAIDGPATKGEVSDAINIVVATRRLDPRMRSVQT